MKNKTKLSLGAQQNTSLRPAQAAEFLGIGLSTIWVWSKQPNFPRPYKIGPKVTVWSLEDLTKWRDSHKELSGGGVK